MGAPMAVKVSMKRVPKSGAWRELNGLFRELRILAMEQPGYISGETVIDAYNPARFMAISTWPSIRSWEAWERDPNRRKILGQIQPFVQGEPLVRLWRDDIDAPAAAI